MWKRGGERLTHGGYAYEGSGDAGVETSSETVFGHALADHVDG